MAVAIPGCSAGVALVAVPAQERGDLGLQRRLQQQPRAQAGDLLHDLSQLTGGIGKQLVDLGADALDRRYSCGHGRGPPDEL
jgi:hypothetical protein